jgi:hypothetical protein
MKGIKPVGISLLTALALMLAVLPASGASAAKLLQLKVGGTPVANGSVGDTGLVLAECVIFSEGTVVTNGAAKDKLTASKNAFTECPAGKSESGTITTTEMTSSGKVTLKGTITISEPGPCVYAFSKFKSTFPHPGTAAFAESKTVGKLNKALSSKTCAKTSSQSWFGDAAPEAFGEPFEDS